MNYSIISPGAKIGADVSIGRFCIIEDKVEIGDRVIIEDYSMILGGSKIGRGTRIGTYTKIGKDVIIGEDCNFTSFCEIRNNCQLGNNVSMGSRCTLSAETIVESDVIMKFGCVVTDTPVLLENNIKSTGTLKRGSRFGANVVIMPSVTVGANSEIGACSQVRHDVPENEIWYGSPAKFFKKNRN